MFQARANNDRAASDSTWLAGFAEEFRSDHEPAVAQDLLKRLIWINEAFGIAENRHPLSRQELLDIGSGSSRVVDLLRAEASEHGIAYTCLDSQEVLQHASPMIRASAVAGIFPSPEVEQQLAGRQFDFVLVNSVLQYVVRDMAWEDFVAAALQLLAPQGVLLLSDLPNRDQRRRALLASGYPKDGRLLEPEVRPVIDDKFVRDLMDFCWNRGFHAFSLPQTDSSPTRLHRHDVAVVRPMVAPYWGDVPVGGESHQHEWEIR